MEIAPDFYHPTTGKTVQEMYQDVDKQGIKKVKVNNSLLEE
jgi:7,8-dihydro-6-hydroxymethylpterin-pyrophosphokinase